MNESKLPFSSAAERETTLVAPAIEQPVAARTVYLQAVCGKDKCTHAGMTIAGRYTLGEKLGEGGMSEVWAASQTGFEAAPVQTSQP